MIIDKALLIILNFYINIFLLKNIFTKLVFKKNISKIIINFVSIIKKGFLKNLGLLTLFENLKSAITIIKVFKIELLIIWILTLVF